MKGKYKVAVQDKRIHFEFEIKRNITIIKGDSATGKTTLVEMISSYEREGKESGIDVVCEKVCTVLDSAGWQDRLRSLSEAIVFIDEGSRFVASQDFAKAVSDSDNYFVLVVREGLPNLPYSVDEIYGIRKSGKYSGLKKTYNELFKIYGNVGMKNLKEARIILTEDSNAGFEFFNSVFSDSSCRCCSAGGKTKIPEAIRKNLPELTLAVADGAAFGSEMERVIRLMEAGFEVALYLPESFEWLILDSGLLDDPEIARIIASPFNYIDSMEYLSWEQFFTDLLKNKTEGTYLQYSKSKLNPVYLHDKEKRIIISKIDWMKKMGQNETSP